MTIRYAEAKAKEYGGISLELRLAMLHTAIQSR